MTRQNVQYATRKYVIVGLFFIVVLLYVLRLFYLQVVDTHYKLEADNIAFLRKTLYPSRGMIYDNKGRLVVYNKPSSNVMVITREMEPFDTLELCRILSTDKDFVEGKLSNIKDKKLNKGYSPYTPQLFLSQVTPEEAGLLQEKLYKFPGFYVEHRTTRDYNYHSAALLLGNVGEVNQADIEHDHYYTPGDYSGRAGIEKSYEKELRGTKGVSILLRDAHGRIQGRFKEGLYDKEIISGHDLTLGIDIELQAYGEKLMRGKRGAIVMIEPSTGEIRCLVTSPSYDPSLLVGRERGRNHQRLEADPGKPFLNRAIMGTYPPGSTFKPVQAAVFLCEGAITSDQSFSCHRGYPLLGGRPGCHGHPSPLPLIPALATSCNAYFCWGLRALLENKQKYGTVQKAFEVWKDHIVQLGFGYKLNIDLPGERRGYIPNAQVYDRIYKERWNSSTIISISIGQGEILATPLQIANYASIVANRGYYYQPHVVKKISGLPPDSVHTHRIETHISPSIFDVIDAGMAAAVTGGTCRRAAIPGITVCGKTGTAENPHGKDHSVFMGYAPRESPRIAICTYVENAGFGATFAVPISKLMLEKYLQGEILPESKSLETSMTNTALSY